MFWWLDNIFVHWFITLCMCRTKKSTIICKKWIQTQNLNIYTHSVLDTLVQLFFIHQCSKFRYYRRTHVNVHPWGSHITSTPTHWAEYYCSDDGGMELIELRNQGSQSADVFDMFPLWLLCLSTMTYLSKQNPLKY